MKKIVFFLIFALAIVVLIRVEGISVSPSDANNEGAPLTAENELNIQETVCEFCEESAAEIMKELTVRHDISIEEIYDLKDASEAQIYERLGKPHGSASGGSFLISHSILENGGIVMFGYSVSEGALPISIYDKNGEFRDSIPRGEE